MLFSNVGHYKFYSYCNLAKSHSKDVCRSEQNVKTLKFNVLRQLLFYAMCGTTVYVYNLLPLKLKWPKNEAVMYTRRHSLKGSEQNVVV